MSLSETIFNDRYTNYKGESRPQATLRVADTISKAETDELIPLYRDKFNEQIASNLWMPAGRIWYAASRIIQMMLNCFATIPEDSREGWGEAIKKNVIIAGTGGGNGSNYCMAPDTKILTQDFKWVRLDSLCIGDKLIGLDEELVGITGRHLRSSIVTEIKPINLPSVKVKTSQGEMVVSSTHPILARFKRAVYKKKGQGFNWVLAKDLTSEYELAFACEPWDHNVTADYQWLGGILDGEGCLTKITKRKRDIGGTHNGILTVGQNKGLVFDKIANVLNSLDVSYNLIKNSQGNCFQFQLSTKWDSMKVLGLCPTVRLWDDREGLWNGAKIRGRYSNHVDVESVEAIGNQDLIAIQTSTKTFIGNGFFQHNSNIRPNGSLIKGTGGIASGPVSLMRAEDAALTEIKGGGGRRAARMGVMDYDHPDVLEFIKEKSDLKRLNNFNVSVNFTKDPEEFFKAVREDKDWQLLFKGQVHSTIKAKTLWNMIVEYSLQNGEPGLLNGYLANKMSNLYPTRVLRQTNPCGEIWLQDNGVCCLGSVVLSNFVKKIRHPNNEFDWTKVRSKIDWDALKDAVTTGVRFLDNVLDVTHYPLPEIKDESMACRRIGLGTMGLHYFLLKLGLKYSSEEGRFVIDKVWEFIRNSAYSASIELAQEKGAYPLFDRDTIVKSAFYKSLPPSIRLAILEHGLRNCAVLDIPPTGTTAMVAQDNMLSVGGVSSGIEPIFAAAYERRFYKPSGDLTSEVVTDPLYAEFVRLGYDVTHFEDAAEIHPEDHLKMQVVCQKYIDNSVSKTINLPQGMYNVETLGELFMKYLPQLKGMTIYPEGSRENSPLKRLDKEEAKRLVETSIQEALDNSCPTGTCSI